MSRVSMLLWLTLLSLARGAHGDDLNMYTVIGMREPFRILWNDGEIGWGSPFSGEVAGIATLEEWVAAEPTDKMAVLVPGVNYTTATARLISGRVAAVVLSENRTSRPERSSQADQQPNALWGMIDTMVPTAWNPHGDGALLTAPGHGVLSVTEEDWQSLWTKATGNLKRWPRYAVSVKSFQWGTTDAPTCLRRGFCDPIGGANLLTTINNFSASKPVVLAAASLDSDAPVRAGAVGARSITGAIALAGAADALSRCVLSEAAKQPVFAFTDADRWGYTGARALAIQLSANEDIAPFFTFPGDSTSAVTGTANLLGRTKLILGVGAASKPQLYSHVTVGAQLDQLQQQLSSEAGVAAAVPGEGLPPNPVSAYLLAERHIPAAVLSEDGAAPYDNQFYDSQFDDGQNVNPAAVAVSSVKLLSALMHRLDPGISQQQAEACKAQHNFSLVIAWVQWASGTQPCTGLCESAFATPYGPGPVLTYASVASSTLTSRLLLSIAQQFKAMGSAIVLTRAVSPGVQHTKRRRAWKTVDKSEPNYAESRWDATQLQLFKQDQEWVEWVVLLLGLLACGGHFWGLRWLQRRWEEATSQAPGRRSNMD